MFDLAWQKNQLLCLVTLLLLHILLSIVSIIYVRGKFVKFSKSLVDDNTIKLFWHVVSILQAVKYTKFFKLLTSLAVITQRLPQPLTRNGWKTI